MCTVSPKQGSDSVPLKTLREEHKYKDKEYKHVYSIYLCMQLCGINMYLAVSRVSIKIASCT